MKRHLFLLGFLTLCGCNDDFTTDIQPQEEAVVSTLSSAASEYYYLV